MAAWPLCLSMFGAMFGAVQMVEAQARIVDDDNRGTSQCVSASSGVPGLWGLPRWPTTVNAAPNTTATDPSLRERVEITDPRWGNAPLTAPLFNGGTTTARDVNYRILTNASNPRQLQVSIQVKDDGNGADPLDYVLFGVANADGTHAYGFRYEPSVSTSPGATTYVQGYGIRLAANSRARQYEYDVTVDPNRRWGVLGSTTQGLPSWVSPDYSASWNLNDLDSTAQGARWAVQFRVDLPDGLTADNARFFVGVRKSFPANNGMPGEANFASANIFSGCGTSVCGVFPSQDSITDGIQLDAAFPYDPADWSFLSSLNSGACANRVNITEDGLFSLYPGGRKDLVYVDPSPPMPNPPVVNQWQVNLSRALANGNVAADLFIANWGTSVAEGAGGWNPVQRNVLNSGATLNFRCQNGPTGLNICGIVGEAAIKGRGDMHQCMQVQLRSAQPTTPVAFSNPSVWSNMYYDHFSEVNQLAEISVKGLQARLKNSNARDVYFHVVRRNMPLPQPNTFSKNTGQLEALRAQLDPSFTLPAERTCNTKGQFCYPNGPTSGTCANPARISETGGVFCQNESTPRLFDGTYWCLTSNDPCVPQAGGGYNTQKSSISPSDKLRAEFINYEVYPYYDTGKRKVRNGVTSMVLVQMPSFGTYFTHEGAVYGFLQGIMEEYGSLTAPSTRPVKQVGPDMYMITIPNEQTARLKIHSETQDTPPETFFQVVGTATPLGFLLGNATFTGIARTRAIDLSKATVSLNSVLNENGRELVSGVSGAITLTRSPGALPGVATFTRIGFPTITMQVFKLPLIGQAVSIQVTLADVAQPTACPLLFGATRLKTRFTINDGGSPVLVEGSDTWACVPGQLLSF